MKVLLAWLVAAASVPMGIGLGRGLDASTAAGLVVGLMVATVTLATFAVVAGPRGGWSRALVVAGGLGLLARGVDAGLPDPGPPAARGVLQHGLVAFEVVAPSQSGPRCRVLARRAGTTRVVSLGLPREHCPMGAATTVWVLAPPAAGPALPGRLEPRARAAAEGVDDRLDARRAWPAADASVAGWIASTRAAAWAAGRGDDARALVAATVVGVRAGVDPRRRDELRAAGLAHLIAVSGLHVALATWLAFALALRVSTLCRLGIAPAIVAALVMMVGYVVLTGAPASAVRAGTMAALVALGSLVGRPAHGLTSLAIAATLMLTWRPLWALDPGFQLSAAAMAAVVTAPRGASVFALTWRITWAIAPISMLHFGGISLWGWIGNLVGIPVVTLWVLPLGLLGLPWVAWPPAWSPAAAGAGVVVDLAAALARLPPAPPALVGALALVTLAWPTRPARQSPGDWGWCRGWNGPWSWIGTWWAAVRPAPIVAVAVATSATLVTTAPVPTRPAWIATGAGSDPWVTVFDTREGTRLACIRDAPPSPGIALRRVEAYGITALGRVTPIDDPAGRALVDLARARGWSLVDHDCELPDAALVRRRLRRCHGAVIVERTGRIRCTAARRPGLLDFASPP